MKQIDGQMSFSFHPIPKAGTSLLLAPVQTLAENSPVLTKEDAVRVLVDSMKRLDREETRVLYLDAGKKPLCFCTVSIGTVSGAPVPIANVTQSRGGRTPA